MSRNLLMHPARIMLVDDHPIVREGFQRLLSLNEHSTVVAEQGNAQQALEFLTENQCDIAVIDYALPDMHGSELIRQISKQFPSVKCLVVSMYDNDPFVSRAIDAGAMGYISKRCAADELLEGIAIVSAGETYLSSDVIKNLKFNDKQYRATGLATLSEREYETFIQLARGLGVKGAAKALNVATKTIHSHRANLLAKLELQNDFQLLQLALKHGILAFTDIVC